MTLTEHQSMALAMFEDSVPCISDGCLNKGEWIGTPRHIEGNPQNCTEVPSPICDMHKRQLEKFSTPFWRTWANFSSKCEDCGLEITAEFIPIGGK